MQKRRRSARCRVGVFRRNVGGTKRGCRRTFSGKAVGMGWALDSDMGGAQEENEDDKDMRRVVA
jgi:hypothetical protein